MKNKILASLLALAIMLGSFSIVNASSQITKEHSFAADSKNDKMQVSKEIKEGGKVYKLKDVKYEYEDNILKKQVKLLNKEGYEKEIEERDSSGKLAKYILKDIKWSEEKREPEKLVEVQEKREDIKEEKEILISLDGKEFYSTGRLADIKEKRVLKKISLPSTFFGIDGSNMYNFYGKEVSLPDIEKPLWDGVELDVKEKLGLSNDSKIISSNFTSGKKYITEEEYQREAVFIANRPKIEYEATYIESEEDAKIYIADISYEKEGSLKAKAICIYEQEGLSKLVKISIGACLLFLAIAIILFMARRRKNR